MSKNGKDSTLAIEGGKPVCTSALSAWPVFNDEQIESVVEVLRSGRVNYWTGKQGQLFEEEYAQSLGVAHAIAVSNGTVALELALHAIDLKPGEEVIIPAHTFVATATAVMMRGGCPVFADIDPQTQNVTAETIARQITPNTKAVIVVHMGGRPCEMEEIFSLTQHHGLKLIEDCAQAHGAACNGKPVGSWGDISAFSFCQDKIITTGGEGGLVVTNNETLWQRAWAFKDHGKNRDKIYNGTQTGLFQLLHDSLGTNGRMTEMQAAIGRKALAALPEWIEKRRNNAQTLREAFKDHSAIEVADVPEHLEHSYYKFYCRLRLKQLQPGWTRDAFIKAVQAEGIPCGSGSCAEIYLEKSIQKAGLAPPNRLPGAKSFGERSLMLQVHPTLQPEEIQLTSEAILKVLNAACVQEHSELLLISKAA